MKPPASKGKARAFRIELDYFKQGDGLSRWKLRLSALVALLAAGWLASGLVYQSDGALRYSHGPLSAAHATWESKCSACHVDFQAIRSDAWFASSRESSLVLDNQCKSCHAVADHYANQPDATMHCASCHIEHRGRLADIARTANSVCLQCHADLKNHSLAPDIRLLPDDEMFLHVTDFVTQHPPFRSLQVDPGNIKFTHNRHMNAGCTLSSNDDDKAQKTVGDLPPEDREKYLQSGQSDESPVQLQCASCHRLDSSDADDVDFKRASLQSGRYMLPITYESHCRACHPLNVEADSEQLIPHGLNPEEIQDFLNHVFMRQFLKDNGDILQRKVTRRIPGKTSSHPDSIRAQEFIENKIRVAKKHLRNRCDQCHYLKDPEKIESLAVLPANIPSSWFSHAVFDHSAHRAVGCEECHSHASQSGAKSDVLIARIETCRRCHGPTQPRKSQQTASGGARYDCVECHTFHGGDHAAHEVDSRMHSVSPGKRLTLEGFLRGGELKDDIPKSSADDQ